MTSTPSMPPDDLNSYASEAERTARDNARTLKASAESFERIADDVARIRIITDAPCSRKHLDAKATSTLVHGFRSTRDAMLAYRNDFTELPPPDLLSLPISGPTGVISIVTADIVSCNSIPLEERQPFLLFEKEQTEADAARDTITACTRLMSDLSCNQRPNTAGKTNADLLQEAWETFRLPPVTGDATGAPLLIVRQCLEDTTESLKRRLPHCNVRGGIEDKVRAILTLAAQELTPPGLADDLAERARQLKSKLTEYGKQNSPINRAGVRSLLSATTNLLRDLLSAVDKSLLRSA